MQVFLYSCCGLVLNLVWGNTAGLGNTCLVRVVQELWKQVLRTHRVQLVHVQSDGVHGSLAATLVADFAVSVQLECRPYLLGSGIGPDGLQSRVEDACAALLLKEVFWLCLQSGWWWTARERKIIAPSRALFPEGEVMSIAHVTTKLHVAARSVLAASGTGYRDPEDIR